jgi:hypothetical protein
MRPTRQPPLGGIHLRSDGGDRYHGREGELIAVDPEGTIPPEGRTTGIAMPAAAKTDGSDPLVKGASTQSRLGT